MAQFDFILKHPRVLPSLLVLSKSTIYTANDRNLIETRGFEQTKQIQNLRHSSLIATNTAHACVCLVILPDTQLKRHVRRVFQKSVAFRVK